MVKPFADSCGITGGLPIAPGFGPIPWRFGPWIACVPKGQTRLQRAGLTGVDVTRRVSSSIA
jgi:hypothetical protein